MTTDMLKEILSNRINSLKNLAQQCYVSGDLEPYMKLNEEIIQTQITLDNLNKLI